MAAGASKEQIARGNREGLYALRRKLLKRGIQSRYEKKTGVLEIVGSNVEWAAYRLLRASNGECALYPRVKFRARDLPARNELERESGRRDEIYEGWDAFDKIALGANDQARGFPHAT